MRSSIKRGDRVYNVSSNDVKKSPRFRERRTLKPSREVGERQAAELSKEIENVDGPVEPQGE